MFSKMRGTYIIATTAVALLLLGLTPRLASADKPRNCKGTKKWYQGKCRYPNDIQALKRKTAGTLPASKPRTSDKGAECQDLAKCIEKAEMYHLGAGVGRDTRKSHQYFKKACNFLGGVSCGDSGQSLCSVALAYLLGEKVERNTDIGRSLAVAACEKEESGSACNLLGYGLAMEGHHAPALKRYLRACKLDSGAGCSNSGHAHAQGLGTPKNIDKARFFLKKACGLGYESACSMKSQL